VSMVVQVTIFFWDILLKIVSAALTLPFRPFSEILTLQSVINLLPFAVLVKLVCGVRFDLALGVFVGGCFLRVHIS